jgi:HEAT repeat protein
MTDLDRGQIKRACSDALHAIQHDKGVDGIPTLAASLADLGPSYRAHSVRMQAALAGRKDTTIIWHLIHVLEKLEKGVE